MLHNNCGVLTGTSSQLRVHQLHTLNIRLTIFIKHALEVRKAHRGLGNMSIEKCLLLASFEVLSLHSPGRTEENTGNVSEYTQSPDRDLNPVPRVYETRVLATQPRVSVAQSDQAGC